MSAVGPGESAPGAGAPVPFAELGWRDGLPWSLRFEDGYFSRDGGLDESRHVFLRRSDLPRRWRRRRPTAKPFTVLEVGFGSGLNFLATCELWEASAPTRPAGGQLEYLAVEGYPLRAGDQRRALAAAGAPTALIDAWLARWPAPTPGLHWLCWPGRSVRLGLAIAELAAGLDMLANSEIDAWFLDGFSPSRNPRMWREALYRRMAKLSAPGASFATYTAAGAVRRALNRHGFKARIEPGFGAKRDMLCGRLACQSARPRTARAPARTRAGNAAIVVGAGLAGCHLAASLATRRCEVCLLEQAVAPAEGPRQAAIYARLSATDTPAARFALACLRHALRHYGAMFDDGRLGAADGALCGMLQLPAEARQLRAQRRSAERYAHYPELLSWVDASRAGELAGVELARGGLHFPGAGWLDTAAACRALRSHPRIRYRPGRAVRRLERRRGLWRALDADGRALAAAPQLALANSHAAGALLPAGAAPALRVTRGQVSYLRESALGDALRAPRAVVCHTGYAMPSRTLDGERIVSCGSTYQAVDPSDANRDATAADHARNWDALCRALSSAAPAPMPENAVAGGYVGLRCETADRLPVVGACGPPGLYIDVGHGSRGVCQTPLCAELLAAHMLGGALPIDAAVNAAVSPARAGARAAPV